MQKLCKGPEKLEKSGKVFKSQTDTEVITVLLTERLKKSEPLKARRAQCFPITSPKFETFSPAINLNCLFKILGEDIERKKELQEILHRIMTQIINHYYYSHRI